MAKKFIIHEFGEWYGAFVIISEAFAVYDNLWAVR